jgi:ComF family protein
VLFRLLTSLVFPHYCPSCGHEWFDGVGFICSECWKRLEAFKGYRRIKEHELKERTQIAFVYNEIARLLVLHMKFYGRIDIAEKLGSVLFQQFYPQLSQIKFEAVIPVPLHSVRVRERGFNQSAVMASRLADKLKAPLRDDLLHRTRNTRPQSRLSNQERENNVIGAFAARPPVNRIPGGTVLLVDDVLHTGSTVKGCVKVLEDIGIEDIRIMAAMG